MEEEGTLNNISNIYFKNVYIYIYGCWNFLQSNVEDFVGSELEPLILPKELEHLETPFSQLVGWHVEKACHISSLIYSYLNL